MHKNKVFRVRFGEVFEGKDMENVDLKDVLAANAEEAIQIAKSLLTEDQKDYYLEGVTFITSFEN